MLKLNRRTVAATLALLILTATARAAQPPVLQQVPDDAAVVIVVKNLKQFATKLSNTGTRMKLPVPEDLLATAMGKFGVTDGLDQNGSMACMLLEAGTAKAPNETFVAVVPVIDSQVMLKSFDAEKPDDAGIMKVTVSEQPCFAAVVGRYVAISPSKLAMQKYMARAGSMDKKLSPESAAAFDANDVVMLANFPAFGTKAADSIDSFRAQLSASMANAPMDKATAAIADEMFSAAFDAAKQSLADANAGLVTLRVTDDGITLGAQAQFKPESPSGKFIAAQKPAAPVNLDGLPNRKLLMAATGTWDKATVAPLVNGVVDRMMARPDIKESPKLQELKSVMDTEKLIIAGLSGEKAAFYEPADPAQGFVNAVILADMDDPQKGLDAAQAMAKLQFGTDVPGLRMEEKVEPNAKTVKGVSLTKITLTYAAKEDGGPQAAAAISAIKTMYGQDGLQMYYGVVGKQLLAVVSNDDKLLDDAITAAQDKDTAFSKSPEVVAADKAALPKAFAIAYLPATRWVTLGLTAMGMTPAAPPANAPPIPPILLSAAATGPNMTTEIHIPIQTLINISTTAQQQFPFMFPH